MPHPLSAHGRGPRKLCLLLALFFVALMGINLWLIGWQFSDSLSVARDAEGWMWMDGSSYPPRGEPVSATSIAIDDGTRENSARLSNATAIHENVNSTTRVANGASPPIIATVSHGKINSKQYHANNTTASQSTNQPLQGTVVLQLSGELGNHISALAYYYAVKTIASTEFNLNLTLHVRKQKNSKAHRAAQNAQCLKSFQELDFDECNHDHNITSSMDGTNQTKGEICAMKINDQMEALYDSKLFRNNHTIFEWSASLQLKDSTSQIRKDLKNYVVMLNDPPIKELFRQRGAGWSIDEPYPFLYSMKRIGASDQLINEFYSRGLSDYLAFDSDTKISSGCCAMLPEEDEQVFHYRSFVVDLPKKHLSWGGAELAPKRAAALLSASLPNNGTKVALVAGRAANHRVVEYEEAFLDKSFNVRKISGQTAIQDFCFLAHARAGLWGTTQSSYVTWASLISKELQNATLYGLNYPSREENITSRIPTNEDLARIIHYPVFDLPDEDVW